MRTNNGPHLAYCTIQSEDDYRGEGGCGSALHPFVRGRARDEEHYIKARDEVHAIKCSCRMQLRELKYA